MMIKKTLLHTVLFSLLIMPSLSKPVSVNSVLSGTRDVVFTASMIAVCYFAWVHFSAESTEAILINKLMSKKDIPPHILKLITSKVQYPSSRRNTYISYALKYPWKSEPAPKIDLSKANYFLQQSHYGMQYLKHQVLEWAALLSMDPELKLRPVCLVGPSGTGKTSVAHAIAKALNRSIHPLSMANDEKYFRGFEFTYEGSEPGAFMKLHCTTQSKRSVILLDELDKLNPKAEQSILEALDQERNTRYSDTFMDFPIDLSGHFFIATANDLSKIPAAIKDRMTIINIEPYTPDEKLQIAKTKFIPELIESYKLTQTPAKELLSLLPQIITLTSRTLEGENGVRTLQQALKSLAGKYYTAALMGKKLSLNSTNLSSFLDPQFSEFRLADTPEDAISYANTRLKKLPITPELFRKIEDRINDFRGYSDKTTATLVRTYIDWVCKYPFASKLPEQPSLAGIMSQLNATHAGISQVKQSMCDYLAGFLKSSGKSKKILCLYGDPGVGKTMAAESIATALNRPFIKISLSNITHFSHERDSHPGQLAKALISAKSAYPVVLLDELDKANASLLTELLEVCDIGQNNKIKDHYLNFDIDFSNALIIATANDISKIPYSLKSRMELTEMHPYTIQERITIAQEHLIPAITKTIPLQEDSLLALKKITPEITAVIARYESGVRKLNQLLTRAAERFALIELSDAPNKTEQINAVTAEEIISTTSPDLLQTHFATKPALVPTIGVVNGMYAGGMNGGGIHKTQASIVPGGTGQLIKNELGGKTAQASHLHSLMFIKTFAEKYNINREILKNSDFAIVKQHYDEFDGPSAGIAQTVALVSALTKRAVKPGFAVTGAMDALGNLIPVGGYRAKILGTAESGITQFIVPECALKTIESLLPELSGITVHFVKTFDEALNLLLEPA